MLQETFKDTSGLAWTSWVAGGAREPPRCCDLLLHITHLCLGEATRTGVGRLVVAVMSYLLVVLWNPGLTLSWQANVGQSGELGGQGGGNSVMTCTDPL